MMEQRKALTIPFAVDKDNQMENPLRIPMPCLSPECGKLDRQVSWTAFAGCKVRHRNTEHKNGSLMFDHKLAAMIQMEMDRKKPRLVLEDVLKTESGMAYMERIRKRDTTSGRELLTGTQRESGRLREEPLIPRDTRSCQKEARNKTNNKSVTPKCNQSTSPASSQRSRLRRRLHSADDQEEKDEHRDIEKVIIEKENGDDDKFSEVVDCGLSVSWEPTEDTPGCDGFSPAAIKDRWTDPEKAVQHSLKRKRKDAETQCNGTSSPKRHRESVLRLTGEDRRDEGPVPTSVSPGEECGDDGDLENQDNLIVQFTVGEDDRTEILVPVISNNSEAGNSPGSPRQSLSFSQENTIIATPSEPIVLSSDEEESGDVPRRRSQGVRTLATVKETVIQKRLSQEAAAKQQEASHIHDMQVLQVVVAEGPSLVAAPPDSDMDYSCMTVPFSSLHSGGYHGKANGGIMIANQKIIIPLTDTSEQVDVTLSFERRDLRRYSIWEQCELEAQELHFIGDEEFFPAAFLLFFVSEKGAAAIQRELCQLGVTQEEAKNTGKASPFILLTLTDPLEGVEGAVLRSLLDIDCLNSLSQEQSTVAHGADRGSSLDAIHSPVLSLEDSIELIRSTGRDSHLLSMLGVRSSEPELSSAQDSSHSDSRDKSPTPHVQLEVNLQKEPVLEPETPAEREAGTQLEPQEDQKEQNIEQAPEKKEEKHTPVYTLCHRRTKATYSVSLCKPDASWTKYKHQGLAHRLIQFPPPPLKGGITVTMEDLQCLDNGQFLNDVIIDFYLKYLLQNASAAVAERSHIFSSFFYKQLTRRDNASEGANSDSCQRQRRHQRVKTWTRHVDIFKKDFLFVPVNQEAHWYLVVICFPGLDEPKLEDWTGPNSQTGTSHSGTGESQGQHKERACKSSNGNAETPPTLAAVHRSDSVDTGTENAKEEPTKEPPPGPVNCSEQTCQKQTVCKRPCILIMDSLKLSLHERVFKLLREYLQSEWEVRRGSSRDFGPDQMKSSHCKVPLQDNSSDCGLYLLQYVECFLKDPVVHFDLPLRLERWFPRQLVRRKRDEIRDLILNLYRRQNLDNRHTKELFC